MPLGKTARAPVSSMARCLNEKNILPSLAGALPAAYWPAEFSARVLSSWVYLYPSLPALCMLSRNRKRLLTKPQLHFVVIRWRAVHHILVILPGVNEKALNGTFGRMLLNSDGTRDGRMLIVASR